ncbi:MAG TPA: hypothetical protein VG142_14725 [Trebonia sp.]|nr:hypothetical protein [Trebonia sp.]
MLSYHIRPATAEDVSFLADVVIEATIPARGELAAFQVRGDQSLAHTVPLK